MPSAPRWWSSRAPAHPIPIPSRFYLSGDIGRWTSDGSITHLGRRDGLLKLDGNRINAAEVEQYAGKCLQPGDIVIVDVLNGELVAVMYLDGHLDNTTARDGAESQPCVWDATTDDTGSARAAAIAATVGASLPRYMVPSRFLLISHVPFTASRKVKRKAIRGFCQNFLAPQ
ncbi:acetyl-CoA synthetase-like protein [Dissoconium aciculare CBS 342.82]|uniref:Acetyl-CoA synthetase-like protein n=1 Tax=Dissoconium aciculare CBS 342.82 TaxID=1314786 RepID=A0A6J3MD91_9PEZI|nr:acetyl-CoA synthetase-like protein [Dissoconium aciculare CBS 342.82]KAF1825853.1 acetyl-CoA synthetase-like protein [Dissoconium aciculare CBS 342.82]